MATTVRKSLAGWLIAVTMLATISGRAADPPVIEVFKLPDCGCCKAWVKYLQARGFAVKVTDVADNDGKKAVQDRFGVPEQLRGCHTAVIDGYVIEGHVAAEEIRHLLDQRPKWQGLFVKGMPKGSPGMEGGAGEAYDVIAIDQNGKELIYAHHEP